MNKEEEKKEVKRVEAIIEEGDFSMELLNMAEDPKTSTEILDMLSTRDDMTSRIARNPSTSVKTLARMTEDALREGDRVLLNTLGHNPSMSAKLLALLGESKDFYIRQSILDNPSAPAEIVEKLKRELRFIKAQREGWYREEEARQKARDERNKPSFLDKLFSIDTGKLLWCIIVIYVIMRYML